MAVGTIGVKGGNVIVSAPSLIKQSKWLNVASYVSIAGATAPSGRTISTVERAQSQFSADSNGVWWMDLAIRTILSDTVTTASLTIAGVTIKSSGFYPSSGLLTDMRVYGSGSTNAIRWDYVTAEAGLTTVVKVELDAEPTWASLGTTASAALEGVMPIVAYIPNMCPTITRYTTGAGTYTVPAGVRWLKIKMIGGGGGGGGSSTTNEGGNGGAGGTTSFGASLLTAVGGSGGSGTVGNGADGGSATVNSPAISMVALSGARAPGNPNNNGSQQSQSGAASFFAGGAPGGLGEVAGYAAIANSGAGGGGGGKSTGYRGTGGGAGGYIESLINSPSSSYAYSVGAAGAAGTAGSEGFIGGAGGSGVIIIEEHYI